MGSLVYAAILGIALVVYFGSEIPLSSKEDFATTMITAIAVVVFAFPAVVIVVAQVACIAMAVVALAIYTMGAKPPWYVVAGFIGGLTGFLLTGGVFYGVDVVDWDTQRLLAILFGPALSTLLLQTGGVAATLLPAYTQGEPSDGSARTTSWLRFEIRQLLIATVWVAAILTVAKLTKALGPWSAGIVAGWFVYQAATLWTILRLARKVRGYG